MKRLFTLLAVVLMSAGSVHAYSFDFYWPWIYANINSNNSTIAGFNTVSNTATWASNETIKIEGAYLTNGTVTGGLLTYSRFGKTFNIGLTTNAVTNAVAGFGSSFIRTNDPAYLAAFTNIVGGTFTGRTIYVTPGSGGSGGDVFRGSNNTYSVGTTQTVCDLIVTGAQYYASGLLEVDWVHQKFYDTDGVTESADLQNRQLWDGNGVLSVDWDQRILYDTTGLGSPAIDWNGRHGYGTWDFDGLTVGGNVVLTNAMTNGYWDYDSGTNWVATHSGIDIGTSNNAEFASNLAYSISLGTNASALFDIWNSNTVTLVSNNQQTVMGLTNSFVLTNDPVYLAAFTNIIGGTFTGRTIYVSSDSDTDTLSVVLGRGNNASGQAMTNVQFIGGTTNGNWGLAMAGDGPPTLTSMAPSVDLSPTVSHIGVLSDSNVVFLAWGYGAYSRGSVRVNVDVNMKGNSITNAGTNSDFLFPNDSRAVSLSNTNNDIQVKYPTDDPDAANKKYVDDQIDLIGPTVQKADSDHTRLGIPTWATNVQQPGSIGSVTNTITNMVDFTAGLAYEYTYTNNVWFSLPSLTGSYTNDVLDGWMIAHHAANGNSYSTAFVGSNVYNTAGANPTLTQSSGAIDRIRFANRGSNWDIVQTALNLQVIPYIASSGGGGGSVFTPFTNSILELYFAHTNSVDPVLNDSSSKSNQNTTINLGVGSMATRESITNSPQTYDYLFSGAQYMTPTNWPLFNFTTTDTWTLAFWVKAASTDTGVVLGKWSTVSTVGWIVHLAGSSGTFYLTFYANGSHYMQEVTTTSIPANIWTHVVITKTADAHAAGFNIYLNGSLAGVSVLSDTLWSTAAPSDMRSPSTTPMRIGCRGEDANQGLYLTGRIFLPVVATSTWGNATITNMLYQTNPTNFLAVMPSN